MVSLSSYFDSGKCFACDNGPLVRVEHSMTITCRYCNLTWSYQLIEAGDLPYIIEHSRILWKSRLKTANSLSDQALLDIVVARGLVPKIEVTKVEGQLPVSQMMKQVYENQIVQHLKNDLYNQLLNGADVQPVPKPEPVWSYEEAAASEFNVMDGEGGLS